MVDEFNKAHGDTINEYHDEAETRTPPTVCGNSSTKATGYSDSHGDLLNAAYVLEGLAEDTLRDFENGNISER